MRIALLTMIEPAGAGDGERRAFLRIGGQTIARHQVALALKLECQRIICVGAGIGGRTTELQKMAEESGARLEVVANVQEAAAGISDNDEMIALADGLFVGPGFPTSLREQGFAVYVLHADAASEGFERLDLEAAAAGIVHVPGRLATRLRELPADYDAVSGLTRIALQSGIARRKLAVEDQIGTIWKLVSSETEAQALEPEWLRLQLGNSSGGEPSRWLARNAVMAFGPSLLHAGSGSRISLAAFVAALLIGAFSIWFGLVWLALIVAAFAWILHHAAFMLVGAEEATHPGRNWTSIASLLAGCLVDLEILVIVFTASGVTEWQGLFGPAFPPIALLLLMRIVPKIVGHGRRGWMEDRAVLCLVLVAAHAFGIVLPCVEILSVLFLIAALASIGARPRLTTA